MYTLDVKAGNAMVGRRGGGKSRALPPPPPPPPPPPGKAKKLFGYILGLFAIFSS